jgi:RNA polymerase sigma-70 factor, ECF subfamily
MSELRHMPPAGQNRSGVLHGRFRRRPADTDEDDRSVVARVVARARLGDREALGYLYVRYADNVYSYVASIVCDEHEAEDVTQQVFAKLMVNLAKYEPRKTPFLSWLLIVSRNVALDHVRRQRAVPSDEVRDAHRPGPPDPLYAVCVRDALAALSPDQREVVFLRHVAGFSPTEIAARTGRTEASVHGLHHRGRGALQATLRQLDAEPAVLAS